MIKNTLPQKSQYDPYIQKQIPLQTLTPPLGQIVANARSNINPILSQLPFQGLVANNPSALAQNSNQSSATGNSQAAWSKAGGCGCGSKGCGAGGSGQTGTSSNSSNVTPSDPGFGETNNAGSSSATGNSKVNNNQIAAGDNIKNPSNF